MEDGLGDLIAPQKVTPTKRVPSSRQEAGAEISTEIHTPSFFAESMRKALTSKKVTPDKIAKVIKDGLKARFKPDLLEKTGKPDHKTRMMAARMAADMMGDEEEVVKKLTARLPADKAARLFGLIRQSGAERGRAP